MIGPTDEFERYPEKLEVIVRNEALDRLELSEADIEGWEINRVREDGAIDALVPLSQIDITGVPTDPRNTARLIELFDERAAEVGGTGQRDPVVVGHVPGETFYMLDGFHRHETQTSRGVTYLHATVETGLTYEEVVKRRLEYAYTHPEIEFARQVEWMQSVWERTPWAEDVPNVLTAFRAFGDDFEFELTDDSDLLRGLDQEIYKQISEWVQTQSKEWNYTPTQIRENLARVESFDRGLMHLVYKGKGAPRVGRISLKHVDAITATYPGEFDLQRSVVNLVIGYDLSVAQTEELIKKLEEDDPVYPDDIQRTAQQIDFLGLKKVRTVRRRLGRDTNTRVPTAFEERPTPEILQVIREMLPEIQASAFSGEWGAEDVDNAMEITMVLSETLAQLVSRPNGDMLESSDD